MRLMPLMTRNSAQATIRKLITSVRKCPHAITAPCFFASSSAAAVTFDDSGTKWFEKSSPPVTAPTTGMMMSPTSEFTMAPKAAPMITPIARSTTLPRIANFLKSSNTRPSRCCGSVDQAGMPHRVAYLALRSLRERHHRQPNRLLALAEHRQRVLGRGRIGFDEQVLMQRHQLVLQLQGAGVIPLQAGVLEFRAKPWRNVGSHRDAAVAAMRHEAERGP